jgi:hypothetical protein
LRRFFAQFFGLRLICPKCHELNTYRRGRTRSIGVSNSWNRITGQIRCIHCHKAYHVGVLLYDVVPEGGKGGHPDQTPTMKELQMIRQDAEDYEAEHQGRKIDQRKKRSDKVNQYHELNPDDRKLRGED